MAELIDRQALLKNVYDNPPEKERMEHGEWERLIKKADILLGKEKPFD